MYRKGEDKRAQIIEAADRLFYEQGYDHTSFNDIARESGIPRGNFYHYFPSKEQILSAVVDRRLQSILTQLEDWNSQYSTPLARLKRYVQILRNSEAGAVRYGCPMGTLNSELGKVHIEQRDKARAMFDAFGAWLEQQFAALGYRKQAKMFARRLLARTQGIAVIAHAYMNAEFLQAEAAELDHWLDSLAKNKRAEAASAKRT